MTTYYVHLKISCDARHYLRFRDSCMDTPYESLYILPSIGLSQWHVSHLYEFVKSQLSYDISLSLTDVSFASDEYQRQYLSPDINIKELHAMNPALSSILYSPDTNYVGCILYVAGNP